MRKGAIYARCSTDMQDQSIEDQISAVSKYAEQNEIEVLHDSIFIDEGKSGVLIKDRDGFNKMIQVCEQGKAKFNCILVYDVSRWGRFANDDEAAYWEHHCRRHGVNVIFTNDSFSNDNSLPNRLVKNLKRSMASEYSRKLSLDVARGQRSNASKGYCNGSEPPYGYRRALVDESGKVVKVLNFGERKAIGNYRIKLVPGDPVRAAQVKEIFEMHDKGLGIKQIANHLNEREISGPHGGKWNTSTLHKILTNPVYIGTLRWGRMKNGTFTKIENTWNDKNGFRTLHDEDKIVFVENAHEPLIGKEIFERVQRTLASRVCMKKSSDGRPYGSSYLATGLLKCSSCGCKYAGKTFLRPLRNKPIQYYWCGGSGKNGNAFCKQYAIPRFIVDSFLVEEIVKRVNDPYFIQKIETIVRKKLEGTNSQSSNEHESIERETKAVENAIESLIDELEQCPRDARELIRLRINKRLHEKQELLRKKQELGSVKREKLLVNEEMKKVREFLNHLDSQVLTADITDDVREAELKKKIVRCFVSHGVVNRESRTINFYFYKIPQPNRTSISMSSILNPAQSTLHMPRQRIEHDLIDNKNFLFRSD